MSDKVLYLLLLFARTGALFILSPLLAQRALPLLTKVALSILSTLIIFGALYPHYLTHTLIHPIWFYLLKELFIGYLIGTLFSFMIEAALLAGSFFATMAGFSPTELLDPLSSVKTTLFAKFFLLLIVALIITMDLHHIFLYFLYDSFTFIPINEASIHPQTLLALPQSAHYIFSTALSYIVLPLFLLLIVTLFMALLAKFYPEIPIFWLGFPIQIFVGLFALSLLLLFIAPLIQKGVTEILHITSKIIF